MKKILALVLTLMLVLGMTAALADVPTSQTYDDTNAADANGKYTISVASGDTHTYTVYQVLTGTLIAGENKLGNPAWGLDATATAKEGTAKAFIDSITSLTGVALSEAVAAKVDTTSNGRGTVDKDHTMDVVPGYYLIVDTTANLADGDSKSLNIVAVFNDITITPKKGTTESGKKVDDKNDSNTSQDAVEWEDSADYDIGDSVPFRLHAVVAEDYANYTHGYKLRFQDKMDAGLTFNNDVQVYIGSIAEANKVATDKYAVLKDSAEGMKDTTNTFEVYFENLKNVTNVSAGTEIFVTFSATLNENAVIGNTGNKNSSKVTYSNNPNDEQAGENGKTPLDTVIVFTYQAIFNKVDGDQKPLTGADFTLYKKVGSNWVDVTALNTGDGAKNPSKTTAAYTKGEDTAQNAKFTFAGLDDGEYKLVESTTPTGYNTLEDFYFTIEATHKASDDNPGTSTLESLTIKDKEGNVISGQGKAFTMTLSTGAAETEIQNNQGSTLPSTGGIGTTLFYVGGGILVLLAVVMLVTKRRMSGND